MTEKIKTKSFLKTGEEFKESLRDGREVWLHGERIEDVTTNKWTRDMCDWMAEFYDEALKPGPGQDNMTYIRDDGARAHVSWKPFKTKEDIHHRKRSIDHIAKLTFGSLGRQADQINSSLVGMTAFKSLFEQNDPEYVDNIESYRKYGEENNIFLCETVVDPQGYRARPSQAPEKEGREVLRVVKEDSTGVWLSGARAVGSNAVFANEFLLGIISYPFTTEKETIWCALPMNSPGLKMISRPAVNKPDATRFDHPLASRGDELDPLIILDEVFVPHERIFSRAREMADNRVFLDFGIIEHWYTMVRMESKAQMFAGLGQLIVDALGTSKIPAVRDKIGELITYAEVLRSMVEASISFAKEHDEGILLPDSNTVTAGRAYALDKYPQILHILRELGGQGMVVRYTDADFNNPEIEALLSKYLDGKDWTFRERCALFNLVWDATTDSHAGRITLFENVNALPAPFLRQRLYEEYDLRTPIAGHILDYFLQNPERAKNYS